jgi:[ribosomal protein S18]-alanine N-acetyltransferase
MLTVQPLTATSLSAAVTLDEQVFGGFWSSASYCKELSRASSDLVGIWVPEQPSILLAMGCTWFVVDETHVVLLAVHPDYRQRSLGLAILVELLHLAHQRGAHYATLEVRTSNNTAIKLYQKLGFTVAGCRPHYYPQTGEDALVLWRSGLQSTAFTQQLQVHQQAITRCWQDTELSWPQG